MIILLPNGSFNATQASALTNFVNGGGRLVISGDWQAGTTGGFAFSNNYVNNLMGSMGVGMSLGSTVVAGHGCSNTTAIASDTLTTGMSQAVVAASNMVSGGTVSYTHLTLPTKRIV